jgi:hypothetical protein
MPLPGTEGDKSSPPQPEDPPEPSSPPESSHEAKAEDEPLSPSSFELARRVLVSMVQAVEDGADLLGASVREELGRFRTDLVRALVATFSLAAGGGLLTAGLALLMHDWIGSWPPVLLVLGGLYMAAGVWLFVSSSASGQEQ